MILHNSTSATLRTTPLRTETLGDVEYTVVPVVMLTEGVYQGTQGPVLYRGETLSKFPAVWNMKPIIIWHPEKGIATAAPILRKSQVGIVMNTEWDNEQKKLKAEAWINMNQLKKINSLVHGKIMRSEPVEVSTGVWLDPSNTETGVFNQKEYTRAAENPLPDHLAILPNQQGACSVQDGCGLFQNQSVDAIMEALDSGEITINAMSYEERRGTLMDLIRGKFGDETWIEAVYDDSVVFNDGGQLYRIPYSTDDDQVQLGDSRESVRRSVEYKLVSNQESGDMNRTEVVNKLIKSGAWAEADRSWLMALDEAKLKRIAGPAAAAEPETVGAGASTGSGTGTTTTDQPSEPQQTQGASQGQPTGNQGGCGNGCSQQPQTQQPQGQQPQTQQPQGQQPQTQQPQPMSLNEYVAAAPDPIRDVLQDGLYIREQERNRLVNVITANSRNTFSADVLRTKSLPELRGIAALAQDQPTQRAAQPLYGGMDGFDPTYNQQTEETEEPMVAGTMSSAREPKS